MQTALNLSRNGARGDIDVIFISVFPDAPHRGTSAALAVTNCEPHNEFSFSTAHERNFFHAVSLEIVHLLTL
jgi:hypothetical protein